MLALVLIHIKLFSAPIGVKVWHDGQFLTSGDAGPPQFLPLQYLKNHVGCYDIIVNDIPAWATINVGKVSFTLICFHIIHAQTCTP